MRRARTEDQIYASGYISLTEIKRLYGIGHVNAKRAFDKAAELDMESFGRNRVFTDKVRIASLGKALGVKLKTPPKKAV